MIDLKAQYGAAYKITLDESAEIPGQSQADRAWLQQIPGRFGHIYIQGVNTLGVCVRTRFDSTDRLGRLLAIPGARLHQRGDHESSIAIPSEHLALAAEMIQAKKRVRLSAEHRAKLIAAGSVHRFPPGTKG